MSGGLEDFRARRATDMRARVERALKDLDSSGTAVTVAAVARAARVSRQWIYDSDYRDEIDRLRRVSVHRAGRPAQQRASDASLRAVNDALRAQLAAAREEKRELRRELERALGLLRAQGARSTEG